jgi:dolichol-phosphate mannosyltransferase
MSHLGSKENIVPISEVSIIIPAYNEETQIVENVQAIKNNLDTIGIEYEFIIVDDGSKDNTWQELKKLCQNSPKMTILRLSRNFGKESAICAGLEASINHSVIVMDCDLQHPPELLPKMIRLWQEEGFDIVECVKTSRGRESLINRVGAHLFYDLLNKLSGIDLSEASDFKLLDKKVVVALKEMREYHTFFRGMSSWVGFKKVSIPFDVPERSHGTSKWSFFKRTKLAINAITSFTSIPMQIVTFLGVVFFTGSIALGVQTLFMKFKGVAFSGFTTVILLLLIIGSTLMISLGIIGTYISKIYDEVKQRPRYVISEKKRTECVTYLES